MKRLISLFLTTVMALSMTACGTQAGVNNETTSAPIETTVEDTTSNEVTGSTVTFFSLSLGENYENVKSMTAYPNEDGTIHVEYNGDVKKVGDMDPKIMIDITNAMNQTELATLNGQDIWGDSEANGSMYIELDDGTMISAGFNGDIPGEYTQGYTIMDTYFATLTAELPVYVPQPMVMGEIDGTLLTEMNTILTGSGIQTLDGFAISQVAKDEYFAYTVGLTDETGVKAAANCAPMMMTTAYSLVIVTLEEGTDATDIAADFEKNLDWTKWVCVAPTDALIATKDNMVLCLMAANENYTQTVTGITSAGWTTVNTLSSPQ